MTDDTYTAEDEATFDEAMRLRDAGDLSGAIAILVGLAKRRPRKPSVVGMLAGLQLDVSDFAESAHNAARAVELSPKSEMASRIRFHALFGTGDVDAAFREVARFRTLKQSAEYERILAELEADTLRDLQAKPHDPFLIQLMSHIREELKARPLRQ